MAVIPCPGCGLPRIEDQLATVPCPICAAGLPEQPVARAPSVRRPADTPDPIAHLPADVSELGRYPSAAATRGGLIGWVLVFLFGVATGAGGLLGWQSYSRSGGTPVESPDVAFRPADPAPGETPSVRAAEVAPMPRPLSSPRDGAGPLGSSLTGLPPRSEPGPQPEPKPEPKPEPVPKPEPKPEAVVADPTEVIELNQPEAVHAVAPLRRGERVVIRGRVKTLRVLGLHAGAVLDASRLEAQVIFVGGKVDGRSTLRLNAPGGSVTVAAAIGEKSSVEINAPGGDVRFPLPTTAGHPGSLIDGGAVVAVTARSVDLRGDVNGIDTHVRVNLPGDGVLKFAAIKGVATVEYRPTGPPGSPQVVAGTVAATATFRRAE